MDPLAQKRAHEKLYSSLELAGYEFHITSDPLTRYLRDRRLKIALETLRETYGSSLYSFKVLSVCGGVGGEGIFFLKEGFSDVTVSDFSQNALRIAEQLNGKLKTLALDAEAMALPDRSYDIVVVHDGLHHLQRPATGFAEMLRVARKAAIVIEPHRGLVGKLIGQEWELTDGEKNYVFRWDRNMIEQTVKSLLLTNYRNIVVRRVWDHGGFISKITRIVPSSLRFVAIRLIYRLLQPFGFCGNNMVAVVVKD
ncbi:MAG: class I SAM-dependent methyltransferase [Bdellovibrionales bacterium]|nr:class I SAM-dependent methyltransferase [Bdellovibrionales bacterium]